MYPEIMVIPMREELTRAGISEARTATEVDAALAQPGTTMVVVNSICGCAAGKMRPGVRMAMQHTQKPDHAVTVFAGQDREATEKARGYFGGHPPTSPAIAILRDGQLPLKAPTRRLSRRNLHARSIPTASRPTPECPSSRQRGGFGLLFVLPGSALCACRR